MNIGDRVRLLHYTQEGIITNFLPDNLVEIEIEDGFKIPVLKQEVVLIAKEEKIVFRERRREEEVSATPVVSAETGFFLAFLPINDKQLSVYLINNTDIDILFNFGEVRDTNYYGLAAGHLTKRSSQKVTEANLDKFDKWSPLLVQAIFFKAGFTSLKEPLIRKFTFSAATFFKSKGKAPLLDKECHLFQIDQKIVSVNPEQIKESIAERQTATAPANVSAPAAKNIAPAALPKQPRQTEIDLHIEQLTKDYGKMNAAQMLELQLKAFETALDRAILEAYDEIVFIHGVGNGTLRNEIHRRLSKHPNIAYYKDARKEKFGYGATQAKIK
jgi:DNA-nicking Smr family endonuclease